MALRFLDSCDHYAIAKVSQKWQTVVGGQKANDRWGTTNGALSSTNGSSHNYTRVLDAQATWIVGFAFSFTGSNATPGVVCRLIDGSTQHVDMRLQASNGQVTITRNNTLLGTFTTTLVAGTWYYIELKLTIHDTAGAVAAQINGVAETITFVTGTGTNQDTRNGGNASADRVGFFASNVNTTMNVDDIYICDASGSVNNNFVGDVRVAALLPTGAGNSTQFTPDTGSNYARVNEVSADGDTSYVESSTASHKDLYAMGNLPTTASSVKGVQFVTQARKTDAGTRTLRHVVRTGGADFESANITLTDSFLMPTTIRETNPDTTAAWTESDINGLEAGVKLQA